MDPATAGLLIDILFLRRAIVGMGSDEVHADPSNYTPGEFGTFTSKTLIGKKMLPSTEQNCSEMSAQRSAVHDGLNDRCCRPSDRC